MDIQLKKGALEICVLSILSEKDYYGYELINELIKYISVSEATVYPILKRLKLNNYLENYLVESNYGPTRKYYRITEDGISRLKELIKEWNELNKNINLILKRGV
ncbi:PadR family transcriptional regulator [Clostridium cibarium]|uniref:PadR family transcriptional regulator n=1 Tax=Clostridium cibarium TaxID=2762247 RepID=A0ABR8PTB6_9CLOT|nr:PadR family transcriptional regulator [Clostridium cibarium]MBD7911392.1 PadR family transcriptional regulator [Clostridium cibarium]